VILSLCFSRFCPQLISFQRFCSGSPANPMIPEDHHSEGYTRAIDPLSNPKPKPTNSPAPSASTSRAAAISRSTVPSAAPPPSKITASASSTSNGTSASSSSTHTTLDGCPSIRAKALSRA